jgi:glycosyltransferase involved in cell wall biosynthesis
MYVYPSIFEETSCISLLESMAAGLYCVTTNYGALFETGAEFPMYIPYDKDYKRLAEKFSYGIEAAAKTLHEPTIHNHLTTQSGYTHLYYGWPKQASSWTRFLQGAINAKK